MRHRARGWWRPCSRRSRWTRPPGSGPNRPRADPAMAADGYGDFQTPPALADAVVAAVRRACPGRSWSRVLEPTCGTGAFLAAAGVLGARQLLGVEISPGYA